MTSRCPTILTANPASIAIGGGMSSTIQNRTHRHRPASPPPRHSHFLSAANSLNLRFPKRLLHHQQHLLHSHSRFLSLSDFSQQTLTTSATGAPFFLLPLSTLLPPTQTGTIL
jgi:hypothetical protein